MTDKADPAPLSPNAGLPTHRPTASRIFLVAGEASGDMLGASLVEALRLSPRPFVLRGMGGPALRRLGMEAVVPTEALSVNGIFEVVRHLPRIRRLFWSLVEAARAFQPDLILLIDSPDFNLRLARVLQSLGCPILYYVSPQLWAWRAGRIHTLKATISHMLVLFPFEEQLYRDAGVPVTYVGHPALDKWNTLQQTLQHTSPASPAQKEPVQVALMPGSRPGEVKRLLLPMLQAASWLSRRHPQVRFVLIQAPTLSDDHYLPLLAQFQLPLERTTAPALEVLPNMRAAWIASGTATLEAALAEVPMVVVYRLSWPTYLLGRILLRHLHSVGMVNILAGHQIMPELLQTLRPERLGALLEPWLTSEDAYASARKALQRVKASLGDGNASRRAAEVVSSYLEKRRNERGNG